MRYAIISRDEDGIWLADVPSLPGCHSFGETREEAIENIREAIGLYLEDLPEERKELYEEYVEPELVAVELVVE